MFEKTNELQSKVLLVLLRWIRASAKLNHRIENEVIDWSAHVPTS